MSRFPTNGGRPAGVRNRFSGAFLTDFLADWESGGAAAIKVVRLRDPSTYLRVAASILPKELMVETMTTGLTAEERTEMIVALKEHLRLTAQQQGPSEARNGLRPMLIEARAEPQLEPVKD
jgi:hypothetical protein